MLDSSKESRPNETEVLCPIEELEELRLLRRAEVEQLTGLSRASVYAMMLTGAFPRPYRTGGRGVGWRQGEIREWLASRERSTGWGGE